MKQPGPSCNSSKCLNRSRRLSSFYVPLLLQFALAPALSQSLASPTQWPHSPPLHFPPRSLSLTHARPRAHTRAHTHTHARGHADTRPRARAHTRAHSRAHTRTQARTLTLTQTHPHTRTRPHAPSPSSSTTSAPRLTVAQSTPASSGGSACGLRGHGLKRRRG
eukprot:1220782-Pleurochrysis_carterae.AAC.1